MSTDSSALSNTVTIICTLLAGVLIAQNWGVPVSIQLLAKLWGPLPLGAALLTLFVLGALAGFFQYWMTRQRYNRDVKQFELRREKAEVKAETSTDQIRALESKVKTLEKALEQALATSKDRA